MMQIMLLPLGLLGEFDDEDEAADTRNRLRYCCWKLKDFSIEILYRGNDSTEREKNYLSSVVIKESKDCMRIKNKLYITESGCIKQLWNIS